MYNHASKSKWFIQRIGLVAILFLSLACQSEVGAVPKAPNFSLKDLSGKTVTLKEQRGKVVVVDFWATWCGPCRASIPGLVNLQTKYKEKGLVVLGISIDDPVKADDKYIQAFCKKFKTNYAILRGNRFVLRDYFGNEGIALPTMFVIDKDGNVRDKIVGYNYDTLEKSVGKLFQ